MTNCLRIAGRRVAIQQADKHPLLSELSHQALIENSGFAAELELRPEADGIHLRWFQENAKALDLHIDVTSLLKQQRSFPAPKQGAFNQALGKKSKHVIDATGGWGSDALLMCSQGYQVQIIERHPIMVLLLKDAMQRLSKTQWAEHNEVVVPLVKQGDAINLLALQSLQADCVYLDPMFPAKRKRSAAVNKQMALLQWLLNGEFDADELLTAALTGNFPRVVVKRPDYAQALCVESSTRFSSKLVHYDVYFT
ncbi:MAG: 16S rRNA (guanine1516-N2)-methyltransferase [Cryomorphaceae bacterium]|jgi:16S rRNA (guanine1516-N2)-methyltransferase